MARTGWHSKDSPRRWKTLCAVSKRGQKIPLGNSCSNSGARRATTLIEEGQLNHPKNLSATTFEGIPSSPRPRGEARKAKNKQHYFLKQCLPSADAQQQQLPRSALGYQPLLAAPRGCAKN